jgi:hypothetical protein
MGVAPVDLTQIEWRENPIKSADTYCAGQLRSLPANRLRNFATFGETTAWQ